jgi:hypothetical protein
MSIRMYIRLVNPTASLTTACSRRPGGGIMGRG